jgi:hypothetical protein
MERPDQLFDLSHDEQSASLVPRQQRNYHQAEAVFVCEGATFGENQAGEGTERFPRMDVRRAGKRNRSNRARVGWRVTERGCEPRLRANHFEGGKSGGTHETKMRRVASLKAGTWISRRGIGSRWSFCISASISASS